MKRRKYTLEYMDAHAAVLRVKCSKKHPHKYEVVPASGYFVHENTVIYATDDVYIARDRAHKHGRQ